MPAVTVADLAVLPRVPLPDPAVARQRAVRSVTTAPRGFEGEGSRCDGRSPVWTWPTLDPFIHLDQMGEIDYGPG